MAGRKYETTWTIGSAFRLPNNTGFDTHLNVAVSEKKSHVNELQSSEESIKQLEINGAETHFENAKVECTILLEKIIERTGEPIDPGTGHR